MSAKQMYQCKMTIFICNGDNVKNKSGLMGLFRLSYT